MYFKSKNGSGRFGGSRGGGSAGTGSSRQIVELSGQKGGDFGSKIAKNERFWG